MKGKLKRGLYILGGLIGICYSIYFIILAYKNPKLDNIIGTIAFAFFGIFLILEGTNRMKKIDQLKVKIK